MKFREAIQDATMLAMDRDKSVFLIGVGIVDPRAVWGTVEGAFKKYGPERVIEGPLSEDMLQGFSIGAATLGMKPIVIHHRMDFVLLTLNQLFNHAAKWPAMFGHQQSVPMVVRCPIGRGWGNGPQHTQSMHALFAHVPGIKAVVPSNPKDAKGLLLAALEDGGPVIFIEHRWLYEDDAEVPKGYYTTPIGKAEVLRQGNDVTVVALGTAVGESLKAAQSFEATGHSADVIDLRTIRPLDIDTILKSVEKTGRLVVADSDWGNCSISSEILARVSEKGFDLLKEPPVRVVWPETCVPSSQNIEAKFYPGAREIQEAMSKVLNHTSRREEVQNTVKKFEGPF